MGSSTRRRNLLNKRLHIECKNGVILHFLIELLRQEVDVVLVGLEGLSTVTRV